MVETPEEHRVGDSCTKCGKKIISWDVKDVKPDEYDGNADCVIYYGAYVIEINHQPMFV